MATREEQLSARADHPDTFVAVDEGDEVVGVLLGVKRAWSDARTNGGRDPQRGWYPLLTIQVTSCSYTPHEPEMKFHAFSTVAENEVLGAQPIPGERIRVKYLGVGKNAKKGQNAAKLFALSVSGRSAEDAAKNVYASLGGSAATRPAAGPAPAPPVTTEDFAEPQQSSFDEDDIPF